MCHRTHVHATALPIAVVATVLVTGLAACAPATPVAAEPTVRVIVRFAPDVVDPLDPAFLARLAGFTHVSRIDPIRPMSGAAYVLQVSCIDPRSPHQSGDPCTSAVARMSRSDAVLGIDVDRREKLQ